MILTHYCKIVPDDNDPSGVILFSNKNSSKISIPKSMLEDIGSGSLSEEERTILAELGFLVESAEEDRREILCFLDKLNKADRILSLQLVMNLDCNLDCGYCFEGSRKGRHYLTSGDADAFIVFVMENMKP